MEDIAYDESLTTTYNPVGDVQTVEGAAMIEQAVVTAIIERVGLSAPPLNETAIEARRGAIQSVVENVQFTRPPYAVTVDAINEVTETNDTPSVVYRVETERISLPITQS
jgi:hypothetical protein